MEITRPFSSLLGTIPLIPERLLTLPHLYDQKSTQSKVVLRLEL